MKVEWHPLARLDLLEIVAYIAKDSEGAAYRLYDEIERQVALLRKMPRIGRIGRRKGTRELVVAGTPYIAAYRVQAKEILILRLLHGARRWPTGFPSKAE